MQRFFHMRTGLALALLIALEVLAVGLGMGVPLFAIMLGFAVGWFAAKRYGLADPPRRSAFVQTLKASALAAGMTFVMMLLIWLPQASKLTEPGFDAAKWGIPLLLYTSRASFVGWLILMMVISPVLQLMASLFSAYIVVILTPGNAEPLLPASALRGRRRL